MILGLAAGWALQVFAGVPSGALFGLLAGMIAANLVPLRPSCGSQEP